MHIPNYFIFFLFSVNEYINRPGKHAVWCTNKIIQSCKYRKIREVDPIDLHHRFQCGSCKDHADYAKYFNTNCKYKKCHDSQHWHNYVITVRASIVCLLPFLHSDRFTAARHNLCLFLCISLMNFWFHVTIEIDICRLFQKR